MSDSVHKPVVGRGAALKRAVLEALEAWRIEKGIGCWLTLADMSGVTTEDIALVRQRLKVPFQIYERLAQALGIEDSEIKCQRINDPLSSGKEINRGTR